MRNVKKNRGITLIALVITIIVLLILAGVSLSLIMGNEGILGKATTAVDKSKIAGAKEELEMAVASVKMGYYTENEGKDIFNYMKDKLNGYETGNGTIRCDETGKVTYTGNNGSVGGTIDSEGNFEFDKIGIFINPRKLMLKIESETMPTENITANLSEIDGDITWISSDQSVATVIGDGSHATVTAVADGTTTIMATCGSYSDTCTVTVKAEIGIGSEVTYMPSGTYPWNAEYATSYETTDANYTSANKTLNSGEGGDFRITKWRVLEIDEEAEIVKMVPMTPTTGTVRLQGAQGYNNAVKLLNDACSNLYASEGVTARSIAIEDFEGTPKADGTLEGGLLTSEAIEERNNYTSENDSTENVKYGERHQIAYSSYRNEKGEYTYYKNYPVMYEREKDSIIKTIPEIAKGKETNLELSRQTQLIERSEGTITTNGKKGAKTASTSIHPKQMYYNLGISYSDFRTKFKNYTEEKTYENIVLPNEGNTRYWIASRYVSVGYNGCGFGVRGLDLGSLSVGDMCSSASITNYRERPLFPVVSLSSERIRGDGAGKFVVE